MKYWGILFLIIALATEHCLSVNIDSLKQLTRSEDKTIQLTALLNLSKELSYKDKKESIEYAFKAIALAKTLQDNSAEIKAITNIADAYYYNYSFENALSYYQQALDKSKKIKDYEQIGDSYNNIGTIHFHWGELNLAVEAMQLAIDYYKKIDDKEGLANSYNNLGSVHLEQGNIDQANAYYEQTLAIKKQSGNNKDVAACLTNIGNVYENKGKNETAMQYYEQALELTKQQKDTTTTAHALSNMGLIYQKWGKNQQALLKMNEALQLYTHQNNTQGIANIMNNIGSIYFELGNFDKALEYYKQSLGINGKLNNKSGIASCYYNIAGVLDAIDDYKQAKNFYEKSLAIKHELSDEQGIADAYNSLGNTFANLNLFDSAQVYYNMALKKKQEINEIQGLANIYQNIGALKETTGDKDNAILYYKKALELDRMLSNSLGMAQSMQRIGTIYKNKQENAKALYYYKQSQEIALKGQFNKILMSNYSYLAELYRTASNYEKALEYQLEYSALRDSIYNSNNQKLIAENQKIIEEIRTKYESEKKEQKILLLEKDRAFKRLWINSLVIGISLIIIFLALLYSRYMVKHKANTLLEQRNKEIELHQQEILDSIFYASRIQNALLPPAHSIDSYVTNYFILNRPRDIVSGDFYWINKIDSHVYIAAADCTGHGIPGAFMSMLGISLLNEVVSVHKNLSTGEILNRLRKQIILSLHQKSDNIVKDGMDIALLKINWENLEMQFSGAHNPLFIVRNNKVIEYKSDKMPIAIYFRLDDFNTQHIKIEKGDRLYLFSDGFVDQFGGLQGKKFMKKNFKELLIKTSMLSISEQKKAIEDSLDRWMGEKEQVDDILVIGIEV